MSKIHKDNLNPQIGSRCLGKAASTQTECIVILKTCTLARLYLLLHKVIRGLHVSTNK